MATAKDVINKITMINNIKYNNNITTQSSFQESEEEKILTSSSSGLASLSASPKVSQPLGEALASNGTLPPKWRGVKLDLFANPGHTLKITIIRHDGTRFACTSNLNSPRSYVFRGRDQEQGSEQHWLMVEYLMELRDDYDYSISKVGKPRKGGTIKDFVAMIYQIDGIWTIDLVFECRIWNFKLDKETSQAFRNKNGIASGYYGITGYAKPWQDAAELDI